MTPKERAMSEPADPGDIWEGIPQSWLDALAAFVAERLRGGPGDAARNHFASLFREAAADQARLIEVEDRCWTVEPNRAIDNGFDPSPSAWRVIGWRQSPEGMPTSYGVLATGATPREAIDAARSVPSPTPTKE